MRTIISVFIFTIVLSGCVTKKYFLQDQGSDKKYLVEYIKTNQASGELSKKPLIVIDGIPYRYDKELKEGNLPLTRDNIGDIFIVSTEAGTQIYGDYGKGGVILITTNKHLQKDKSIGESKVLILLGNKEISRNDLEKLDPNDIEKIKVIKKKEEIKKYTSELYDGVVIIYLKDKK